VTKKEERKKRVDVEGRARGSQTEARFGSGPHRDGRRQTSDCYFPRCMNDTVSGLVILLLSVCFCNALALFHDLPIQCEAQADLI
jgi:hypothetical protein